MDYRETELAVDKLLRADHRLNLVKFVGFVTFALATLVFVIYVTDLAQKQIFG